ncbi:MAG: 16S rRNA (uracil(1498)-N(3))-methyltransferase [Burkholderiales bacterium]
MAARLFVDAPLSADHCLTLPEAAARHVQVLRMQPGEQITLFNGLGGEWSAVIERMGRREVAVQLLSHAAIERELATQVTLAVGMPANERFDWLVEKATELGVGTIQPLVCERSVLRLAGERAERKREHWQAVAIAAAEQCGRNRVPHIATPAPFARWVGQMTPCPLGGAPCWLLSLAGSAVRTLAGAARVGKLTVLSGPEGGLSPTEEALALQHGFMPVTLGPRTLRAETAPLMVLSVLGAQA